jgi:hypothetical protein
MPCNSWRLPLKLKTDLPEGTNHIVAFEKPNGKNSGGD